MARTGVTDPSGRPTGRLVDAGEFLAVATRLREVHARLERARLEGPHRARLHRCLADIADDAATSLDGVVDRLDDLEGQLPPSGGE